MITSHHNPLLKDIRRLAARRERGRFVAEGEDLLAAAQESGWAPVHLLRAGVEVSEGALAKVSSLGSGTRALAVFEERWAPAPVGPLCVALWGVKDPGNVGTVLRAALAFGVDSVVLGPGTADPYGPKAVRASMGAIFAVPVARAASIEELPGVRIALDARRGDPLRGPAEGEVSLVVGAERAGLSQDVLDACDRAAHIPIANESLNAAMAATLAVYELIRVTDPEAPVLTRIEEIHDEGLAAIDAAASTEQLEELRVRLLGRKAELPNLLRGVGELEPAQRGQVGKRANEVRKALEARLSAAVDRLDASELDAKLITDRIDVTLPGDPLQPVGRLHLITQTWRELEDVFVGLGFTVMEGNEVETVRYNFDALNHDPTHPARGKTDTFYVADDTVLRTHTSPMQVRAMEAHPPPLYVVIPGRVYRRDSDATHTPQFHQVEGLAVDEDITLADLKGTLLEFSRAIFGDERDVRLRGHFFPFTEPSVEVDVSCFNCNNGWLKDGSRCPLCRGEGWIEILGAGEVDPNVYSYVDDDRYDPEKVQGFAWGMGIERIAFLKHGVSDLRLFYENDLRFLEQFG